MGLLSQGWRFCSGLLKPWDLWGIVMTAWKPFLSRAHAFNLVPCEVMSYTRNARALLGLRRLRGVKGQPGCSVWHNNPSGFMLKECGYAGGPGRCFSLGGFSATPVILLPQTNGELKIALGLFLDTANDVVACACYSLTGVRRNWNSPSHPGAGGWGQGGIPSLPTAQICMAFSPTAECHQPAVGNSIRFISDTTACGGGFLGYPSWA